MTAPSRPLPLSSPARATVTSERQPEKPWNRPQPSAGLMSVLGVVSRFALLRTYFRVQRLDLPGAELDLLRSAVNADTAAFLGPNHPEFGCDWMIDKEISTIVAPRMASWADRGIVAAAPKFWGMNNLIANDGGEAAREYSIESALRGDHTLLHPEGTVRWTSNFVHPLFPGIAQMAIAAAARTDKPVFMVPLVWKLCYVGDVSRALDAEIDFIASVLNVELTGAGLAERFAALQEGVLGVQMKRFGYDAVTTGSFFDRQTAFQRQLIDVLLERYDAGDPDTLDRLIARLSKQAKAARQREDVARAEEAKRLGEFSREIYAGPTLSQEEIGESLKRMRDRLVRSTTSQKIANALPRPYGARVAHVGVPQPLRVTRSSDEKELLEAMRASMQAKLDEINARIEPSVMAYRVVSLLA